MSTSIEGQSRTWFVIRHDGSGGTAEGLLIRRGQWRVQRPGAGYPSMVYGPKAEALRVAAAELEREADSL